MTYSFKQGPRKNLQIIDEFLYEVRQSTMENTLSEELITMLSEAEIACAYLDGYLEGLDIKVESKMN